MSRVTDVERQLMRLPAADRERLALRAWESLVNDTSAQSDPDIDIEGIELALTRDGEIKKGAKKPLSKEEFHPDTVDDLNRGIDFYEQKREGLGNEFRIEQLTK